MSTLEFLKTWISGPNQISEITGYEFQLFFYYEDDNEITVSIKDKTSEIFDFLYRDKKEAVKKP